MDKENLFESQKVFLIYLMGLIPSLEDWRFHVDYKTREHEIESLTLKDIKIEQATMDMWNIHGEDISEKRYKTLKNEKEKRIKELKESFGFETENKLANRVQELEDITNDVDKTKSRQEKLWDLLHGKGLVKEKEDA